jgi:hypothetical protein
MGVGTVLILLLYNCRTRGAAHRMSKVDGPMDKMDCSKRRVKSKPSRQPRTVGPKTSSSDGRQVVVVEFVAAILILDECRSRVES